MKALITGASGFIGSTLIDDLNRLGFEVRALMRKTSDARHLEGLKYTRVEGDLEDFESLKRAAEGVNYVFHLAGNTAARDEEMFMRRNGRGTGNLARAVAEVAPGLTRFVYVSSLAAGGPAKERKPRTEAEANQPVSAYGRSKLLGEEEALKFKDVYPITIIRPPLVYGPRDKGVFLLIKTVAKNWMPILSGRGEGGHKYYSAVYVKDLCKGIVQAALAPADKIPSGEIFYICEDENYSYKDFLLSIADTLGNEPIQFRVPEFAIRVGAQAATIAGKLLRKSFPLNQDKVNELLPDYWICSNEKAKRVLGFIPDYPLNKGMPETVEWYKKNGWL